MIEEIKAGDLVAPKPQYLGQTGVVTATLYCQGTKWLVINGSMLPEFKYQLLR